MLKYQAMCGERRGLEMSTDVACNGQCSCS